MPTFRGAQWMLKSRQSANIMNNPGEAGWAAGAYRFLPAFSGRVEDVRAVLAVALGSCLGVVSPFIFSHHGGKRKGGKLKEYSPRVSQGTLRSLTLARPDDVGCRGLR
jgi:hypothetical protein